MSCTPDNIPESVLSGQNNPLIGLSFLLSLLKIQIFKLIQSTTLEKKSNQTKRNNLSDRKIIKLTVFVLDFNQFCEKEKFSPLCNLHYGAKQTNKNNKNRKTNNTLFNNLYPIRGASSVDTLSICSP